MINGTIKKRWTSRMYLLVLLFLFCFILLAALVIGDPPTPHNVAGKIYTNDSNGVPNGVPVTINNTATGDVVATEVYAQQVPELKGIYSATIDGNDGDLVTVVAWNGSHWGNNSANLETTTTTINVKLNNTRDSEANVTIIEPLNDTLKNKTVIFNVTVNITILGNDGADCNATLSFSDENIINISPGENFTHELGNIHFENYKLTNWSVRGLNDGSANITVKASCGSDGKNFEHLNKKTVYNITIQNLPPIVSNVVVIEPIDLVAGDNVTVFCNATVNESNTILDIRVVNATFYQKSFGSDAEDDNNYHYTNSSCVNVSSSTFQSNYSCGFKVAYYANNGTWECNVTATDFNNQTDFDNISTSINELLAIEIPISIIDYGGLEVTNVSSADFNVTIKNYGNMPFNTTIRAYAPNETLSYLNLSMACGESNISNAYQRFSVFNGSDFADMTRLNNDTQLIRDFTRPQRTDDLEYGNDTNTTYWKLQVPVIKPSLCNGTLLFSAIPVD